MEINYKQIATILIVLVLGLIAVNLFLDYRLKITGLVQPCLACKQIVEKQVPGRAACLDECLIVHNTLFHQPNGDIKDSFGNCYDASGSKKVLCKDTIPFIFNNSFTE